MYKRLYDILCFLRLKRIQKILRNNIFKKEMKKTLIFDKKLRELLGNKYEEILQDAKNTSKD